jgi:hypothetical protein
MERNATAAPRPPRQPSRFAKIPFSFESGLMVTTPLSLQLPAGWEKKITPDGQIYYVDHNTQSTHWDPPAAAAAPAQPSQAVGYVNTRPV